jgi:hypothetical protein
MGFSGYGLPRKRTRLEIGWIGHELGRSGHGLATSWSWAGHGPVWLDLFWAGLGWPLCGPGCAGPGRAWPGLDRSYAGHGLGWAGHMQV